MWKHKQLHLPQVRIIRRFSPLAGISYVETNPGINVEVINDINVSVPLRGLVMWKQSSYIYVD